MNPPPDPTFLTAASALLVLAAILVIARMSRHWTRHPSGVATFLSGPWAPVVVGLVTGIFIGIVWGSFHEPGSVHDERAYLLQAEIFARGHWTAPPPPLAAFFEQMH